MKVQQFQVGEEVSLQKFVAQQLFGVGQEIIDQIPLNAGYRLHGHDQDGNWRSYWAPKSQIQMFSFVKQHWPEAPHRWVWVKDGKVVRPTEV
jgi:hypothetical protein